VTLEVTVENCKKLLCKKVLQSSWCNAKVMKGRLKLLKQSFVQIGEFWEKLI
jgi:hypothetical protein